MMLRLARHAQVNLPHHRRAQPELTSMNQATSSTRSTTSEGTFQSPCRNARRHTYILCWFCWEERLTEMMEAVELEMIPWILELRSAEPWLQQQKRLHATRLGRSPWINLATEDHQLYANWAECTRFHRLLMLNERETSLGFHHARKRSLAVRLRLRLGTSWFERSSESPEPQVSISGCERARYIQLRNARVAKKADI
jgi:hypothetical protein